MNLVADDLSPLGQAALEYATQRGWAVFPIVPNRKKPPLIADNYNLSSKDPEQIKAWWREAPTANIGVDCGKSGIVGIDADSEAGHGKDHTGLGAHLAGLMLLSGGKRAWQTFVSQTPTGGEHYIFSALADDQGAIKTDSDNFGVPGIDVRAKGGYLVLPPSTVNYQGVSGEYRVLHDRPLLPLPRKLLSPPGERRDDLGRTAIEATLQDQEKVPKGGRDNFLIAWGGKLRHLGANEAEVRAVIEAAYFSRCETQVDPFGESDFQRLAKSAMKWADDKSVPAKLAEAHIKEPEGHYHETDEAIAVPASSFLVHYTAPTNWIVEGIFQGAATNMSIGSPKAGKSTLLRHLALSCAYGLPFLGRWETKAVPVLYYTLQENKPHLRNWLRSAIVGSGLAGDGEVPESIPIDLIFSVPHKGERAVKGLHARIKERAYGLVIVDMVGDYAGVDSFDDYAETVGILGAINEIAKETGSCILWSHHERKARSQGFEGGIGSQAWRGAVYTTFKHWKDQGRYYISTEQRDGDDIPPTAVTLDKKTQAMRAVGGPLAMAMADETVRERKVRELLQHDPDMGPREVADIAGGRVRDVAALMDRVRKQLSEEGK